MRVAGDEVAWERQLNGLRACRVSIVNTGRVDLMEGAGEDGSREEGVRRVFSLVVSSNVFCRLLLFWVLGARGLGAWLGSFNAVQLEIEGCFGALDFFDGVVAARQEVTCGAYSCTQPGVYST